MLLQSTANSFKKITDQLILSIDPFLGDPRGAI